MRAKSSVWDTSSRRVCTLDIGTVQDCESFCNGQAWCSRTSSSVLVTYQLLGHASFGGRLQAWPWRCQSRTVCTHLDARSSFGCSLTHNGVLLQCCAMRCCLESRSIWNLGMGCDMDALDVDWPRVPSSSSSLQHGRALKTHCTAYGESQLKSLAVGQATRGSC